MICTLYFLKKILKLEQCSMVEDRQQLFQKRIFLQTVDFLWRSHLQYLEHLRQVVGLRSYAHKDPLDEFKREAFKLFEDLLNKIKIPPSLYSFSFNQILFFKSKLNLFSNIK